MLVSSENCSYQSEQSSYFTMNKSSAYQTIPSPIPWIRNDIEYTEMNSLGGQDLTNYLPKTLPGPQHPTKVNYDVPSLDGGIQTTQPVHNNYRQTRKRRRKIHNSNNSINNSSDSSSDTEFDGQPLRIIKKQREIANDRERKRTKQLNEALSCLRRIIPALPADKLSKYQTIRLATQYIEFLWTSLRKHENQMKVDELNYAFTEWRVKTELQMHHS